MRRPITTKSTTPTQPTPSKHQNNNPKKHSHSRTGTPLLHLASIILYLFSHLIGSTIPLLFKTTTLLQLRHLAGARRAIIVSSVGVAAATTTTAFEKKHHRNTLQRRNINSHYSSSSPPFSFYYRPIKRLHDSPPAITARTLCKMSLTNNNNNNNNDDDGSSPPSPPRSSTAPSFTTFLQNASLAIRSRRTPNSSSNPSSSFGTKKRTYHIFMGNEAGDMDSLISALALAYVVSLHNKPTTTTDHHFYIPLISIPRNDMHFRRDATLILEKCGIDPSTLLYVTDEDVTSLLFHNDDDDEIFITLTDHNQLISPLSHLSSRVESIYDHHDDVGCHPHVISPRRNIAFSSSSDGGGRALVGSTCTLVVERLMKEETDDESSSSSMMMKNDDIDENAKLTSKQI